MDKISEIMLKLVRFIFTCEKNPDGYEKLSDEECKMLYALAKRHEIAHMLDCVKTEMTLFGEVEKAVDRLKKAAIYRYLLKEEEYKKVTEILEKEKIKYMPLKGTITKKFYPEEWMRTSADIDILIHEEDISKVKKIFTEQLSYEAGIKARYDMALTAPSGVKIEMHFKLVIENEKVDRILHNVWDNAAPAEESEYRHEMPGEIFLFYHLAHMAKHLKNGGCGIRYYIDYYLIKNNISYDEKAFLSLIQEANLTLFMDNVERIISKWFYGEEADAFTKNVEEYIVTGGIHGNAENHAALHQNGKHRKLNYVMSRIFLKKSAFIYNHPEIEEQPWLIVYYQFERWMRIFNKKRALYGGA